MRGAYETALDAGTSASPWTIAYAARSSLRNEDGFELVADDALRKRPKPRLVVPPPNAKLLPRTPLLPLFIEDSISASPFPPLKKALFVVEPAPQAAKMFWNEDELLFEELNWEKRSLHPGDVEFVLAPAPLEKIDHEKGSLPLLEVDCVFELEDVVAAVANTAGVVSVVAVEAVVGAEVGTVVVVAAGAATADA